jgi:tripartite ATP-independent transporter DctP family solute receptor
MLENVQNGEIDITLAPVIYLRSMAPKMDVLQLPFLFKNYDDVDRILNARSEIGRQLLDELERRDIKGLTFWEIGFRHITTSRRHIDGPWDLKGLRIRTTANEALIQAFMLLGANAIRLPFGEVYTALERGVLDGQEETIDSIYRYRLYEIQRYLSLTRHAYTTSVLVMNRQAFRGLTTNNQNYVLDAAREASDFGRDRARDLERENINNLRDRGMQVQENPDWQGFRKVVFHQVQEKFVREDGRKLLKEIERYLR